MTTCTTNGITVSVETEYRVPESNPLSNYFVFAYLVTIENGSTHTVQLLRRHWYITNANGEVREVEGAGVIGEQPVLAPGHVHRYTSYCELATDLGKMRGHYLMRRVDDEATFEVDIPEFKLEAGYRLN